MHFGCTGWLLDTLKKSVNAFRTPSSGFKFDCQNYVKTQVAVFKPVQIVFYSVTRQFHIKNLPSIKCLQLQSDTVDFLVPFLTTLRWTTLLTMVLYS